MAFSYEFAGATLDSRGNTALRCGPTTGAIQARINDLGFLRAQIVQRGERGGGGQGMFGGLLSGGNRAR